MRSGFTLAAVLVLSIAFAPRAGIAQSENAADPLADWGVRATTGAAAGYVPDAVCATCHGDKAESYSEMGMAKSFYRPSPENVIEDFPDTPFYHAPSERYYRIDLRDGAYWFSRHRLAADGTRVDVFETEIDWILGSGHHTRTYLFQSPNGTLTQLPLAWYSEDRKWEMAPGYEFASHPGVTRTVPQRCMACHNAYAEVPEGSDSFDSPHSFPANLPEGIGCQRCHGPGAEHARLAIARDEGLMQIKAAIVHPGKLPYERRYGICYGCHMQPSVAISSPLRAGRGEFSFRPGEDIAAFLTHIDITDARRPQGARFDINHHPYRLEQSACFLQTADRGEGQLGCLNCHDPHIKINPVERAAHYRAACLQCHQLDMEGRPEMRDAAVTHPPITDSDDCTLCHMPKRRTQDVIHVTMTDHKITRDPGPLAALIAPIPKVLPDPTEVFLLRPHDLSGDEKTLQELRAVLSHSGPPPVWATTRMHQVLRRMAVADPGPWLQLARAFLAQGHFDLALEVAQHALTLAPDDPAVHAILGIALLRTGQSEAAIERLRSVEETRPDDASNRFNHALALALAGRTDAALKTIEGAIAAQQNSWPAHRLRAQLLLRKGRDEEAIQSYLDALAVEPDATPARQGLQKLLLEQGRLREAARHAR